MHPRIRKAAGAGGMAGRFAILFKYYAPDVGLVLTETPEGREELTQITKPI